MCDNVCNFQSDTSIAHGFFTSFRMTKAVWDRSDIVCNFCNYTWFGDLDKLVNCLSMQFETHFILEEINVTCYR